MAYRFLLEVPESLAAEANTAVAEAADAQVVLVRSAHGLGFDDPSADLTVAAHSLRVVDTLYDWFDALGASRPDIRIVLHGGDRLSLEAHDRGGMIAAIRRDQPWVERTIPKIGDHEIEEEEATEDFTQGVTGREARAVDAAGANAPGIASGLDPSWIAPGAVAVRAPERRVRLRALNHIAVRIADLAKAERFYADFLGMELIGRARRDPRGEYRPLDGDYRWDEAVRQGTEADVTFMRNGPLTLALQRVGRGARLERTVLDHVSLGVDATTFTTLKGEVLMRSFETLAVAETAFTFRDPFGITWELTVRGTPGLTG